MADKIVSPFEEHEHKYVHSIRFLQFNKILGYHLYWGTKSKLKNAKVYKNGHHRLMVRCTPFSSRIQFLPYPQLVEAVDQLHRYLVHLTSASIYAKTNIRNHSLMIVNKPSLATLRINLLSEDKGSRTMNIDEYASSSLLEALKNFNCRLAFANLTSNLLSTPEFGKPENLAEDFINVLYEKPKKSIGLGRHNYKRELSSVCIMQSSEVYTTILLIDSRPVASVKLIKSRPCINNATEFQLKEITDESNIFSDDEDTSTSLSKISNQTIADIGPMINSNDSDQNEFICSFEEDITNALRDLEKIQNGTNDSKDFLKQFQQTKIGYMEFKKQCKKKIDSRVSYSEFTKATTDLRIKLAELEEKFSVESCSMCQEISKFKEELDVLESSSNGHRNYSIWSLLLCISLYTILNFGWA